MKGQATLTVKDKLGNIKSVTTKDNVVFDIPKHFLQNGLTYGLKYSSSSKLPGDRYFYIQPYFDSITVHDVPISTTDPFEVRCPLLSGGTQSRSNTALVDYVQYDAASSSVLGNTIIRRWDWANVSKNMSIKSIAMGHTNKMSTYYSLIADTKVALGADYVYNLSNDFPALSKFTTNIDIPTNRITQNEVLRIGKMYDSGRTIRSGIFALPNDEYAILRGYDDMTTDETQSYAKYLYIVKFTTTGIVVQRKWALTDFISGLVNCQFNYVACTSYNGKNYICIANSSSYFGIYVIPDTQVAPSSALTGTTYISRQDLLAYGNSFLILNSNYRYDAYVIGDNDTISLRTNVLNGKTSPSYDSFGGANPLLLKNEFSRDKFLNFVNTTALNFDTPIAVTAGDTLSIVYTITAN